MKGGIFVETASYPTIGARLRYIFGAGSYGNYPDIQAIWDQYKTAVDPKIRKDLIGQVQKMIYEKRMLLPPHIPQLADRGRPQDQRQPLQDSAPDLVYGPFRGHRAAKLTGRLLVCTALIVVGSLLEAENMSILFSPLRLRQIEFKNRIFVSPMCQYSSESGLPGDWHFIHLGSRAVGGAGLVFTEATAVSPEGRISPWDLGIWSDQPIPALRRITSFIRAQGAVPGIQLAHAGRKASTDAPWRSRDPLPPENGGWQPVAPSPIPLDSRSPLPRELSTAEIEGTTADFVEAARRSLDAGFESLEIHMAHGYLFHQFLSPLTNARNDRYGGSLESRARFPLETAKAVREVWPAPFPLFVRISCTDWLEKGWDLAQSIELCRRLKKIGVDLIDCSSGGLVPDVRIPVAPGYQTPFAATIRQQAGIATGAVGLITEPAQAEQIVSTGQADAVFLAREFLRDPHWPLHAARTLGVDISWPKQYARAKK